MTSSTRPEIIPCHDSSIRVGKFLRDRWIVRGGADWIAVCGADPYRRHAHGARYGTGRSSVFYPNVVHFGAVLLLAGILSAPWKDISLAAIVWGLLGLSGIVYEIIVARRMRVQRVYKPVFEDWLFHVVLPFAAYATLAVMAFAAGAHLRGALFGIGGAAMLLLFIGIHNAWDAVTYHVFESKTKP